MNCLNTPFHQILICEICMHTVVTQPYIAIDHITLMYDLDVDRINCVDTYIDTKRYVIFCVCRCSLRLPPRQRWQFPDAAAHRHERQRVLPFPTRSGGRAEHLSGGLEDGGDGVFEKVGL